MAEIMKIAVQQLPDHWSPGSMIIFNNELYTICPGYDQVSGEEFDAVLKWSGTGNTWQTIIRISQTFPKYCISLFVAKYEIIPGTFEDRLFIYQNLPRIVNATSGNLLLLSSDLSYVELEIHHEFESANINPIVINNLVYFVGYRKDLSDSFIIEIVYFSATDNYLSKNTISDLSFDSLSYGDIIKFLLHDNNFYIATTKNNYRLVSIVPESGVQTIVCEGGTFFEAYEEFYDFIVYNNEFYATTTLSRIVKRVDDTWITVVLPNEEFGTEYGKFYIQNNELRIVILSYNNYRNCVFKINLDTNLFDKICDVLLIEDSWSMGVFKFFIQYDHPTAGTILMVDDNMYLTYVEQLEKNSLYFLQQTNRHLVKRFNGESTPAIYDNAYFGEFQSGITDSMLNFPSSITSDLNDIFICDTLNYRILRLNSNLQFISKYDTRNTIGKPNAIMFHNGFLYVVGIFNNYIRLQKLTINFDNVISSSNLTSVNGIIGTKLSICKGFEVDKIFIIGANVDVYEVNELVNSFSSAIIRHIGFKDEQIYTGSIIHSNGYLYLNSGFNIVKVNSNFENIGVSNKISKVVRCLKEDVDGNLLVYNVDRQSVLKYDSNLNFLSVVFEESGHFIGNDAYEIIDFISIS